MKSVNHAAALAASIPAYQRSPRRVTITLPWALYRWLQQRSDQEGRSLSNLAAHLLETAAQA